MWVLRGGRSAPLRTGFGSSPVCSKPCSDTTPETFRPPLKTHPNNYTPGAVVVIENGANDELVPDDSKQRFFAEMTDAGVEWVFNHHAHTPHGFALPPTLGPPGRLHVPTDRRATVSMLALFREVFPGVPQNYVAHNAAGTAIPG